MPDKPKCDICEGDLDDKYGHNADPAHPGICCGWCNDGIVIGVRAMGPGVWESMTDAEKLTAMTRHAGKMIRKLAPNAAAASCMR